MSAADALHPEQLRMFMTAREITESYRPNEPDRLFHGTNISVSSARGVRLPGGPDPRAGEWTGRDARTDEVINEFAQDPRGNYHPRRPTNIDLKGSWAQPETDEQMYARKLNEAQTQKRGEVIGRGRVRSIPTLAEDIAAKGVQNPIALGHQEGFLHPGTEHKFVAGGHHRIAVMSHLNPDQLMPVVHVRSVGEAQGLGH
jgi:hypothetical protein